MLATMGSLGQDLAKQIKKGANPIVLVGHSWGGDTAYEFARHYLARAIEENKKLKTKVILLTFDAVGEKGEYHRTRLSKNTYWINLFVEEKQRSGCGEFTVKLANLFGSNPYGHQRNADRNIPISDVFKDATHCSTDAFFYAAQQSMADEIKGVCGKNYLMPKADWRDGKLYYYRNEYFN